MKDITFNLKREYFEEIKKGIKVFEYRLYNDYWKKRLENKNYKNIMIKLGYPKKNDFEKILEFPYLGYEIQTITHKHFGNKPVKVFAIHIKKLSGD